MAIVIVNVLIFVGQMVLPGPRPEIDGLALRFALSAPAVWQGEVWRLLTAAFIHFGAMHIFFNMFVLWDIGRLCEIVVGPGRYVAIYLASALGGTIASTLVTTPGAPGHAGLSGGASGALFGVAGALLVLVMLDKERRVFVARERLRSMLLRFLGINVVLQFVIPHIDIAAHMGGLVAGAAVAGLVFGTSRVAGTRGPSIRITSIALLAVVLALGVWSVHPVGHPSFEAWRSSPDALIEELLGR
jgi:rhomboid protease GluP